MSGNVFKDANKQLITERINKEHIKPSLVFVEEILGFKLNMYLGTTGISATSGDMDVAVSATKHDRKAVATKLREWAKSEGLKPADWVKLSGTNVHFKTPIREASGEHIGGYAQLDLMFGDPAFQQWSMRGEQGAFKGAHRHILMASIAKAQGLKWSYLNGLTERDTKEQGLRDPHLIVETLLPEYVGNVDNLSVESILEHIYTKHAGDYKAIEALIGEAAQTLAEHHDVMLPMPETTAVTENDTDEYFLARLRDKIISTGSGPLMEKTNLTESKLRAMNHLEDLVLEEGPDGIIRSIKILRAFAEGKAQAQTTIKWDGSPAIVFGRNEQGEFVLTDKSGYTAKGYDGKVTSAKALGQMFANRNPVMDQSRQEFVNNMVDIFDEYQKATPVNFRGYLSGDLMYYNTPGLEDQRNFVFQPNVVRYEVPKDSKLGKAIGQSKTGIVVHNYVGTQYNNVEQALKQIKSNEVLVIPPVHLEQPSKINTAPIDKLEKFTNKHINDIRVLFDPSGLKGIANIHKLMYKYINNSVDTGLDNLGADFEDWLNTENLTERKRANILKYLQANAKGVQALWTLISGIMKLKDYLVREFDSHPSTVQQSIGGKMGGEGYVVRTKQGLVKLVSRGTFTAANRAAHR